MDENYRKALGEVLLGKRQSAGLNKQQLALMIGANRLTIRRIEEGIANPTIGMLMRIAQGLEVSLADVFIECERLLAESGNTTPIPPALEHPSDEPGISYYLTRM